MRQSMIALALLAATSARVFAQEAAPPVTDRLSQACTIAFSSFPDLAVFQVNSIGHSDRKVSIAIGRPATERIVDCYFLSTEQVIPQMLLMTVTDLRSGDASEASSAALAKANAAITKNYRR